MAERVTSPVLRGLRRYSRHLLIPEVGVAGQERLSAARVLCIGAGGLGSPVLQYLAAAGVGRIGIVDDDTVDESNLQRQTLFATGDIGKPKATVAAARVLDINPLIAADAVPLRFNAANARELVRLYDVVVDCTDRFETRYLINDACFLEGKPDVYGSIFRFDGQISVFDASGPCYRCLFPEAPPDGMVPTCAEGGVLGVLAGIVGAFQAAETLKLILGIGETLQGRLMVVDSLGANVREFAIERDPSCALCSEHPTIHQVREGNDTHTPLHDLPEIDTADLDGALDRALLLDVREPHEAVLGLIDGAVHIPASDLPARLHELDSSKRYIVACRVGQKSLWAAQLLRDAGFTHVEHLRGGLLPYAVQHQEFEFF